MKKVYAQPTFVGAELLREDILLASAGVQQDSINGTDNVITWWGNGGSEL